MFNQARRYQRPGRVQLVAYAKQREVPLRNLRCRVDLATGEEVFAKKHGIPYRDS